MEQKIENEEYLEIKKHKDFQKAHRKGKHKSNCKCGYCTMDKENIPYKYSYRKNTE